MPDSVSDSVIIATTDTTTQSQLHSESESEHNQMPPLDQQQQTTIHNQHIDIDDAKTSTAVTPSIQNNYFPSPAPPSPQQQQQQPPQQSHSTFKNRAQVQQVEKEEKRKSTSQPRERIHPKLFSKYVVQNKDVVKGMTKITRVKIIQHK